MLTWFSRKKNVSKIEKGGSVDFTSIASHELRSPLSIIKWYTEILLDGDAGPLTEDQRKYLTVIESSNQRAIDLVRSLLNVSRLDLDTFSISPIEISFPLIVEEAVHVLQKEATKKSIEIVTHVSKEIPTINADKHLCLMVIKNLVSNAIYFSKEHGTVTIKVDCISGNENMLDVTRSIVVTVTDNGIGIPEEDSSKVFSKMFKASNVQQSENTGPGLGLYISKKILDYVGGKVWFTSVLNEGSVFYAAFPTRGMDKKEGRTTLD